MRHATYDPVPRPGAERGPALYFGYCGRTGRYRMMDLSDYLSNVQEGMTRFFADASTMYQEIARGYPDPGVRPGGVRARAGHEAGCGCGSHDCHCECCVCEADVLVHARCNEIRRIPVIFENDTRRDRPVKLELEKFVTVGGRELGWDAQISESAFTLRPCDEHTVTITVPVRCEAFRGQGGETARNRQATVDRCEVAYATLRADGCLVRPIVLAVAVLPDDCDAYRRPCGCGCCH